LGAAAVFPSEHFLADNIGLFPHRAFEQLQILDDGSANLAEIVDAKHVAHRRLDEVPQRRLRREQVARAANGFDCSRQSSVLFVKPVFLNRSERSEQSLLSRVMRKVEGSLTALGSKLCKPSL